MGGLFRGISGSEHLASLRRQFQSTPQEQIETAGVDSDILLGRIEQLRGLDTQRLGLFTLLCHTSDDITQDFKNALAKAEANGIDCSDAQDVQPLDYTDKDEASENRFHLADFNLWPLTGHLHLRSPRKVAPELKLYATLTALSNIGAAGLSEIYGPNQVISAGPVDSGGAHELCITIDPDSNVSLGRLASADLGSDPIRPRLKWHKVVKPLPQVNTSAE